MLEINVPKIELLDESTIPNRIIDIKPQFLQLEHSLVSISKWESRWCKAFINTEKTREETIDYIRCMTINKKNVDPDIYEYIPNNIADEIHRYINAPMTATVISDNGKGGKKQITSERIYYWMLSFKIPVEFEKWHLNRLMTLIALCVEENEPKKELSTKEVMEQNRRINAMRKKKYNTRG